MTTTDARPAPARPGRHPHPLRCPCLLCGRARNDAYLRIWRARGGR